MGEPSAAGWLGRVLEVEVGDVAHGGHCVARFDGRVVFVRHALPGERVLARVTEDPGGSFARADAIEVLTASPDRVIAPCAHAGPGRCGGCDWQHARPDAQRELKARVVREQLRRLAGLEVDVEVEELPGGPLGWRTRIGFAADGPGQLGLLAHRSRRVVAVDACPLGIAGVGDSDVLARRWPGESRVEVVGDEAGSTAVLAHRPAPVRRPRGRSDRRPAPTQARLVEGPDRLRHQVEGFAFDVRPTSFWQVHPAAAATLARAVIEALAPQPGESVLDLYAGAGLFTALFARAVGPTGRVIGVESDRGAVEDAAHNLRDQPWASVQLARVTEAELATPALAELRADLVVLDPPRAGAGAAVMSAILALGGVGPRAVAYVACDPASLARDIRVARDQGWRLRALRAFDAFPMTHHTECVATLTRN